LEILIYAGAIMVLFLFIVMMPGLWPLPGGPGLLFPVGSGHGPDGLSLILAAVMISADQPPRQL
jgi:hypothetical protein